MADKILCISCERTIADFKIINLHMPEARPKFLCKECLPEFMKGYMQKLSLNGIEVKQT